MSQPVTLLRVFLAAPSDIDEERTIIFNTLHEWNDAHGPTSGACLKLVGWKTDCAPAAGERPQAIINEQALDKSDILVGVFWSRFGSPTGVADSGTEEEIRRSMSVGRRVLLYFSRRPVPPEKLDAEQYRKVQRFQQEFQTKSLYRTYQDIQEFHDLFRRHLALAVQDVLRRLRSDTIAPSPAPNSVNFTGSNQGIVANQVVNPVVTVKMTKKRAARMAYPEGSIGADIDKRNYLSYLAKQYNTFREADASFGSFRPFHYSVIHKNIEARFGNSTYNLPVQLFEAVADYVKGRIDRTILGKKNASGGIQNYKSFETFIAEQLSKARRRNSGP